MTVPKEPISLQQLRALAAVSDVRSFSVAAERLAVSQPSVSHLIRRLEERLGLPLVVRGRGIHLTPEGTTLAEVAARAIQAIDVAIHECQSRACLDSGQVTITVGHLSAATLLPRILSAFNARHPTLGVTVIDCTVDQIKGRLQAQEAEIGIGAVAHADDAELSAVDLWEGPVDVFCRKDHPLARSRRVDARRLRQYDCIQLNPRSRPWVLLNRRLSEAGVELNVTHRVLLLSTVIGLLQAGMGIAVLPRLASAQMPREIRNVPLAAPSTTWKIAAIRLANRPLSPAAQAFIQVARAATKGAHLSG